MNRGEIRDRVEFLAPFTDATEAQLNSRIEEAHKKISEWCGLFKGVQTEAGVEGQQEYDLEDDFLGWDLSLRPTYDDEPITLRSIRQIQDEYGSEMTSESGTPLYIAMNYDFKTFLAYPIPDDDATDAGQEFAIPYIAQPVSMASDASDPWNSVPAFDNFHYLIAELVVTLEKEGIGNFSQAINVFRQQNIESLQQLIMKAKQLRMDHGPKTMYVSLEGYND